jgi:asparagine synthase (glutamine-hydrolysing)
MCGIAGIVDLLERRPVDRDLLGRMTDSMTHRGPDGSGFHVEPGVGFGHRRLSIIDLEGGKQPLYNEDGTVVVTYNGEIYNFQDIEDELRASGHQFRTRCDTEVIVHAWEQWGEQCVDRFNGMFAFAVWDQNKQTLFLARDRLGVKPLYYTITGKGILVFGSELKALLHHPDVPRDVNAEAVESYFTLGYVPDPRTIYSGVFKLEPGCRLKLIRGGARREPERYWDVPLSGDAPQAANPGDTYIPLIESLRDAVDRRLISDVPLGAFLSGGVDSSAVVAMMRSLDVSHLLTCSIGFADKRYDESIYAQMVADAKATDHKAEIVEPSDESLLDSLVNIYDEPYADSSALPTFHVCKLARKHVTVALSGDGGDENFLGYRRYRFFALEETLRNPLPYWFRRPVFGALGRWYPKLDWAPRPLRGKSTLQALARSATDAYLHAVSICSDDVRSRLFSDGFHRQLQGYDTRQVFGGYLCGKTFSDPLRMAQYLDFKTYLPGDILTKVDRASMANSLEVRVPFLDYRFVEQASGIPTCFKLKRGEGKYVLKKALEPHLPREVLYRSKMGFAVPLDAWFRGSLKQKIADAVKGERLKSCGVFRPEQLDRLVDQHQSGTRDNSALLWALLMYDGFLNAQGG